MKRTLAFILAAIMLFTLLTACGGAPEPEKTPEPTVQEPEPEPAPEPAPEPEPEPEPQPAEEEYFLEREEGMNQLTLYWTADKVDYSKCDVWVWFPGRDGAGQLFHPCEYGAKCMVNVPSDVEEVGFIVRRDCSNPGGTSWGNATKDFEEDRFAIMNGDTEIYLKSGEGMQYTSPDGGKTLNPIRDFTLAGIISENEIRYFISPAAKLTSLDDVTVRQGDTKIRLASLSSLNNSVVTGVITTAEPIDVSLPYSVEIAGYGSVAAVPTGIFDSAAFIENYTYDGDDLGAVIHGDETTFKLWAPTASEVILNLFEAGDVGSAYEIIPMERGDKGVWHATAKCGHGTYYTYTVTTSVGTQDAVDPYARALGVNGNRGMVIDLRSTDPEGFRDSDYMKLASYSDAVIWEVHVRDFSEKLSASKYPGKYLAFTVRGLKNSSGLPAGVDYLANLGITHVHLQPVYDYATVDETRDDQFNWGYDPKNYNAPEGSYSTDPYHGEVRVNEFKQMVQSLHEAGIGVVMDMVYNHTYSLDSNLNRIVPYYYYRFNASGAPSNGSGCGNETASERVMFRKYMVDSVSYWATEYKLDGFRFDLMALHDTTTMQEIEKAVHAINPSALIYGEGWTGGTSTLRDGQQASQKNIRNVAASEGAAGSIAVFNDAIRDGLKGSVFDEKSTGYATGTVNKETTNKVIFGLTGGANSSYGTGWAVNDAMVINYTSAHDNHTLWDKLTVSCPDASREDMLKMNRLCAAAVMMARGTPFFLAGEEFLRSKGGDSNSYASSDEVNNIDWDAITPGSDEYGMIEFYKYLIALRRDNEAVRRTEPTVTNGPDGILNLEWEGGVTASLNPAKGEFTFNGVTR